MLNFNCLNKALLDANLDHIEFRILYLIANSISLSGEDEITMYNEYIAEKLNITKREVQKITSSLVKKGYIIKTPTRVGNKKPNMIKLDEQSFTDSSKVNEQPFVENEKVNEQPFTPYKSKVYKKSTSTTGKNVSIDFKWLNQNLVTLSKTSDRDTYDTTDNAIANYLQDVKDRLSEKQQPVFQDIVDRWCSISDSRDKLFNGGDADATTYPQTGFENIFSPQPPAQMSHSPKN